MLPAPVGPSTTSARPPVNPFPQAPPLLPWPCCPLAHVARFMELSSTDLTTGGPFWLSATNGLFQAVLDISLIALQLWLPLYGLDNELADFALDYLNPAGQRMLTLPEQPGGTLLTRFPGTQAAGTFAFYRQVFETGKAGRYNVNYQHNGFDNYYHIAARRHEGLLVVSFTDTADHDCTPVKEDLRASQARERAALAAAGAQHEDLQRLFEQAPMGLATFHGPRFIVQMANPAVLRMWGRTLQQTLNTPLFGLLPEAAGQGFEELLVTGLYQRRADRRPAIPHAQRHR